MATWIGAYIEIDSPDQLTHVRGIPGVQVIRQPEGRWLYLQAEVGYASLVLPPFAQPLSAACGARVIAFLLQSTASVEEIVCFDAGERVRHLHYSTDEGGWLVSDGEPQPWEAVYFFEEGSGTAPGEEWPINLADELEPGDLERYRQARGAGDASGILDLLQVGSGSGLLRLAAHLGCDPASPHAIYRPPANRWARLLPWAIAALFVACGLGGFLLGRS